MSALNPNKLRGFTSTPLNEASLRHILKVGMYPVGILLMLMVSYVIGKTDYGVLAMMGLVGGFLGVAILLRPHLGMYILVGTIYINLSWVMTGEFDLPGINKPLIALLVVSVLSTQLIIRRKPLIFRWTEGVILLYIIVMVISIFVGGGVNADTFENVVDTAKDFFIVLIIVQLADNERVWKNTQVMLVVCAVVLSSFSWYHTFTDDFEMNFMGFAKGRTDSVQEEGDLYIDVLRSSGPLDDPNYYAQILLMVFPIALYRGFTANKGSHRKLALLGVVIIAGAIVFTYSRGALIVMVLISLIVLRERGIPFTKIFTFGLIGGIMLLPILPAGYAERVLAITGSEGGDVSTQGRTSEALVAFHMFRDNPLLGVGYGLYGENYLNYSVAIGLDDRLEDRAAHSLYLEALAETGIIGLTALFLMIGVVFATLARVPAQLERINRSDLTPWVLGLALGLLAYLLSSIFLHDDYARYLRLSFALAVSSTVLVNELTKKASLESPYLESERAL